MRRHSVAFVVCCLLGPLLGAPAPGHAGMRPAPPSADRDYWGFADRITAALDAQWSPQRGAYIVNGNASTRQNSMMLLVHSIAALTGHQGPTRQDARARLLVDRLTRPPAWMGAHGPGSEARRSTCWSALLDFAMPQHQSLEPKAADALAWAWRARAPLGLPPDAVARIVSTVDRCARSPAWRYPRVILNQINWNAEMYAADATVTGRPTLLVRDYRRQLVRFSRGITRARGGARAPNLGSGYEFHYNIERPGDATINLDSPEYAGIVVDALSPYARALAAGMRPLPDRSMRLLRAWVLRLLAGGWTHAGYLNWDTGHGRARWNSAEYWAFAQQGLLAIAASPRFWLLRREGRWAKAMFGRALLLARRLADEQGTELAPPRMFGVQSAMEHAECFCPRMAANAARAVGIGLGALPAGDSPPLYAFDPDTGRLAVTTPWYSTAILPDNRGALPYGGIDPARLFGPDQTVAGNVGGTPPDAFGIVIADPRGREVLASQHARPGSGALRVTGSPQRIPRRPRAYPARPYAGPFSRLAARGAVRRDGLEIVARHEFGARAITSRWTFSCSERGCRRDVASATFPTYGAQASIDVTLADGRRVRLAGPFARSQASIALARVAEVRLQGRPSGGYRLVPVGPRPRARLLVAGPVSQWTDPLAGPTLVMRLSHPLARGAHRLAVRILPFR